MICDSVFMEGAMTKVYSLNTIIVGGGIAGLNAALNLYEHGQTDIAILIDSAAGSTSRYACSDQQAYYKLASLSNDSDSPYRMAKALQSSNSSDGDIALVEASLSLKCFYRLTELGLAFPQNQYGEYIGTKAGQDSARRCISCGPNTTAQIHQALEREVKKREIPIFYGYQLVRIFTDVDQKEVIGLLALNYEGVRERHQRYLLFNTTNVILATGGPGGLFHNEAYPAAHTGCLGMALEAGAKAVNLTEFQYGICAASFSLTMNGAYQEAIPRYISVDAEGNHESEFLLSYFDDLEKLYSLIRLKGTQWAFDAKKVREDGTSLLDLLIYHEISMKGRRVFMDYRANPKGYVDPLTPAQRLQKLSPAAYQILLEQGINPVNTPVEVCTAIMHHNGGLAVDFNWESTLKHLFPIGEAAGTHGFFVPMGASINETQVSGLRAASYIASQYQRDPMDIHAFVERIREAYHQRIEMTEAFISELQRKQEDQAISIRSVRTEIGKRMDKACGLFRDASRIAYELKTAKESLRQLPFFFKPYAMLDLSLFFKNYDLLICQIAFLSAMLNYDHAGGQSRGSYLLYHPKGSLPHPKLEEMFRFSVTGSVFSGKLQEVTYQPDSMECEIAWRPIRPIPKS
ncbi:MAG: FAD-binding protein [Lachnospiraceae bacterium]|jgi:succinate dehydrogenase/fumarate reductase flavoprotein subunit|nr:FAD-binding protein [Lachnospiraceae bacterium]